MKKRYVGILLLIIVIAFGVGYWWQSTHQLGELKYVVQKISVGSKVEGYVIEAEYPVIESGIPEKAKQKIDSILYNSVEDSVNKTKVEFIESANDPIFKQNDIELSYTGKVSVKNDFTKLPYINVSFETYYYSGGAHGITNVETFVFDANTGEKLNFENVFNVTQENRADFLQTLSSLSLEEIKLKDPKLQTYTFAIDGTKPVEENFKVWTLLSTGLRVTFTDYQIGPYVVGRTEIEIPYEKLGKFINKESPIGKLIVSKETH